MIFRVLILLAACCPAATAEVWQANQASGTLQFTALQAGARFTGGFGRFDIRLELDPAQPAGGSLNVTVAVASIDTQDADRDGILKSRDFFWAETHPEAVFHSGRIERDGTGWRATGSLTLRGTTKPASVRFTLAPAPNAALLMGTSSLRRLDFGLGQGDWASTEWIGDEVEVRFELRLRPADR